MTKFPLMLAVLALSITPVLAQEQSASESASLTEAQSLNPVSADLSSENVYPACHRMKNGVSWKKHQTADTE